MKAYLIDVSALIYRIYHALPRLTDSQGRPIQVLYGLSNILLKLLEKEKPDFIYAIYDRPEPTIRHQIFKEYKATRPKITDDLKIQISLSKKIFFAFNIPIIEKPGYEADDLIAALKEKLKNQCDEIIILTGDLDTLQLVDEKTKILTMKKGISETFVYDEKEVEKKYEIKPWQIPDYKALVGDASDNIVGIKGIGPKTASYLLKKFNNLENLIQKAEEGYLNRELKEKIIQNKEKLLFNKNLVTLKSDFEIEIDLKKYSGYQKEDLIKIFQEFEFRSLIKRISEEKKEGLFSLKETNFSFKEINSLKDIKGDFFFVLENEKIKLVDEEKVTKILEKKFFKDLFFLPQKIFTYNLKSVFKEILLEDFYFDKKINLEKIFDLKIIFWLLNSHKKNPSLEEIFFLENPKTNNFSFNLLLETGFKLLEKLKNMDLESIYLNLEVKIVPILARAEIRGIKVNLEELYAFRKLLEVEKEKTLKEIKQISEVSLNPLSQKELRNVLFNKLKIKSKGLAKTPKGEISTSEEELLKIIDSHPVIPLILKYRKIIKFLNTYTENFLKNYSSQTKKIHTFFEQTKVATGRIVSEKPNLQNIPLEGDLANYLRRIFIPEEGFVFISFDYSQIELRILAHLSEDENLIKAFKQDLDIHSQTAKLLFGSDDPQYRKKAKAINFGIVYGISPRAVSENLKVPISEAQKIIKKFFYFYPGVKKYQEEMINFARANLYVETLFKRRRLIPEINSLSYREKSFGERAAINMPIQGLAADLIKKAMIKTDEEIYKKFISKAYLLLQIHDELIFEVKEEIKEEFKFIIKEIMNNIYSLKVPLKVNIKEGKDLSELVK